MAEIDPEYLQRNHPYEVYLSGAIQPGFELDGADSGVIRCYPTVISTPEQRADFDDGHLSIADALALGFTLDDLAEQANEDWT